MVTRMIVSMELSILHCHLKIPWGTSQQCSKSHLFRGFCCQSIAWRVGHGMQDAAVKSSYQVAGTKQLTWPGHVNACWFKGCHVTWTLVAMSTGSCFWCHVVSHRCYTWGRGWMTKASGVGERRKGRGELRRDCHHRVAALFVPTRMQQWYIDIWYITMIYIWGRGQGGALSREKSRDVLGEPRNTC